MNGMKMCSHVLDSLPGPCSTSSASWFDLSIPLRGKPEIPPAYQLSHVSFLVTNALRREVVAIETRIVAMRALIERIRPRAGELRRKAARLKNEADTTLIGYDPMISDMRRYRFQVAADLTFFGPELTIGLWKSVATKREEAIAAFERAKRIDAAVSRAEIRIRELLRLRTAKTEQANQILLGPHYRP